MNQGFAGAGVHVPDKEQGDGDQNHHGHEAGKRTHLGIPQIGAGGTPPNYGEVQREIHRRDQHEADGDDSDRGTVKKPQARVMGREPTDGDCGEGMGNRVKEGHPDCPIGECATDGQSEIDVPECFGGLRNARRQLVVFHRPWRLSAVQLHTADPEHGHHGNGEHDDAHAAQPLQLLTVIEYGGRQCIEAGQHRCPCCRQAGHGFK